MQTIKDYVDLVKDMSNYLEEHNVTVTIMDDSIKGDAEFSYEEYEKSLICSATKYEFVKDVKKYEDYKLVCVPKISLEETNTLGITFVVER